MKTNIPASTPGPLRILCLLNLDWNRHLGAARIYMELCDQWRAAGHTVEHFSFSQAFPDEQVTARQYAMRRLAFPGKAAAFVRDNKDRFDVVDALTGSLAVPKSQLGLHGLLVARSVGSHRMYDKFERTIHKRWPGSKRGSLAGRLFYSAVNRRVMSVSDAQLAHADLINVPNTQEVDFLSRHSQTGRPIIVQPYGLTDDNAAALQAATLRPSEKLMRKKISFVGMWSPRKGSRIWGDVVRRVRKKLPNAEFRFLGTMVSPETVLKDLTVDSSRGIESLPEFSPADLPYFLSDCTVGAFPSFIEGFGLAVIEQLAAGVPTVAFDQGGPHDILRELPQLLVPIDDTAGFADRLVSMLQQPLSVYEQLVQASIRTAGRYSWWQIAKDTLATYRSALAKL